MPLPFSLSNLGKTVRTFVRRRCYGLQMFLPFNILYGISWLKLSKILRKLEKDGFVRQQSDKSRWSAQGDRKLATSPFGDGPDACAVLTENFPAFPRSWFA